MLSTLGAELSMPFAAIFSDSARLGVLMARLDYCLSVVMAIVIFLLFAGTRWAKFRSILIKVLWVVAFTYIITLVAYVRVTKETKIVVSEVYVREVGSGAWERTSTLEEDMQEYLSGLADDDITIELMAVSDNGQSLEPLTLTVVYADGVYYTLHRLDGIFTLCRTDRVLTPDILHVYGDTLRGKCLRS